MALGGGLAVFLSTAVVLLLVLLVPNPFGLVLNQDWRDVVGFGLGCGAIVLLGLFDDRFKLRGRHKLLGQVAASSMLLMSGLVIHRIVILGYDFDLGLLAIPFTLFWLVGATNAVNLLDGIDGLATTLGIVLSGAIAAMAAMTGHAAVALVALVFSGSLVGFLRYNFPPASIFLGDAGSMLIGLTVGALAIRASLKGPGTALLAAPLALWTIPVFDSVAAILRRRLTGRSIYTTDRAHLHHRLLQTLGSSRRAVAVVAVCCTLTAVAGLAGVYLKSDAVALASGLALVLIFVVTGLFGRAEFQLLAGRIRGLAWSLAHPFVFRQRGPHQARVRLQGTGQWERLWETLTETADKLGLQRVHLDVNLPLAHEGFDAVWERTVAGDHDECWQFGFPLAANDQLIGRLTVSGHRTHTPVLHDVRLLLDLLEPFDERLQSLTAEQMLRVGSPTTEPSRTRPEPALAGVVAEHVE